jgi:hypothetical protein
MSENGFTKRSHENKIKSKFAYRPKRLHPCHDNCCWERLDMGWRWAPL